jgi:hypothetical protein
MGAAVDFDSVTLTRILEVCSEESGGPEETVHLIRQRQHSFAPTMYSAWEREGQPLNPALRYELDLQRSRIQLYRDITARITERVPDAVPLKGLQVAALYPPDIVRYMNDLDYVVPDQTVLWQLAGLMVELDWPVESATFMTYQGELHIMVSFRRPNTDRYALPFGVEIATHVTLGNLSGVPPVIGLPPAWRVPEVKNLVMLLFERFEQRYRARDIVDGAIQLNALGPDRFPLLAKEIQRLGLWPEYAELRDLLGKAETGDLPPAPPAGGVRLSRARRVARAVMPFAHPVSAAARELQRRMVYGKFGRLDRRAWSMTKEKLNPTWALGAGLLCFGLPVDGGPTGGHTASVHHRDAVCWVETPIGRFLLTPGTEIDEDALDVLPVTEQPLDVAEHKA